MVEVRCPFAAGTEGFVVLLYRLREGEGRLVTDCLITSPFALRAAEPVADVFEIFVTPSLDSLSALRFTPAELDALMAGGADDGFLPEISASKSPIGILKRCARDFDFKLIRSLLSAMLIYYGAWDRQTKKAAVICQAA